LAIILTQISLGPFHRPSADNMQVEMKHSLACTWANVQNCSVPVLDPTLPRDLRRNKLTVSKKFGIFRLGFLEAAKMFFGTTRTCVGPCGWMSSKQMCDRPRKLSWKEDHPNDSAEQAGIHKCCRFSF
jgi:hypothetical protein